MFYYPTPKQDPSPIVHTKLLQVPGRFFSALLFVPILQPIAINNAPQECIFTSDKIIVSPVLLSAIVESHPFDLHALLLPYLVWLLPLINNFGGFPHHTPYSSVVFSDPVPRQYPDCAANSCPITLAAAVSPNDGASCNSGSRPATVGMIRALTGPNQQQLVEETPIGKSLRHPMML